MKRFSCFLLAILMLLSLAPVATADISNTLTVQTRTAQYTFKVGEIYIFILAAPYARPCKLQRGLSR